VQSYREDEVGTRLRRKGLSDVKPHLGTWNLVLGVFCFLHDTFTFGVICDCVLPSETFLKLASGHNYESSNVSRNCSESLSHRLRKNEDGKAFAFLGSPTLCHYQRVSVDYEDAISLSRSRLRLRSGPILVRNIILYAASTPDFSPVSFNQASWMNI
jgi:hypothetical protein